MALHHVTDLLAKAVRRSENGGDGSALSLLRAAWREAELLEIGRLTPVLRDLEAVASAGMSDQACALDNTLEAPPFLGEATLDVAAQKLRVWAEGLWASEERVVFMRRCAAAKAGCTAPLALALSASARNLARSGRRVAAMERCEEALSMWRRLGADNVAHLAARFGETLRLMGALKTEQGDLEVAVIVCGEACRLFEALEQSEPGRFQATLASALHNLAGARARAGGGAAALIASRQAISLRRALAAQAPSICALDLARGLSESSLVLSAAGLSDEARSHSQEAAQIFRAASREDDDYVVALAAALRNFSQHALSVGQCGAAREAVDEEIAIYRRRLRRDGGAAARALANALHNQAALLAILNLEREALASASEAIEIRRSLGGDPVQQGEMATYLHLAGVVAHRAGEPGLAVEYLSEAAEVRNLMRDPRSVDANEVYHRSCIELADAQCSLGRLEDAAKSSEQAGAAMSFVTAAHADKALVLKYARVLLRVGDLQRRAGLAEAAIKSYETAASLPIPSEGLGAQLVGVAIQRLVVCLRRSGYAQESRIWAAKLGGRES